ncbi:hypothetical protein EFV59_15900 [Yersinia enterocolitica]|nr:hypothetical protein [Yersinia enterocolitica]
MTNRSKKNCSITKHTYRTLKERLNQIFEALNELRSFHENWSKELIKKLEDEIERLRPQIKYYFGY